MKFLKGFGITVFLILIAVILISSYQQSVKEELPVFPIPESDLNKEIVITKLDGINSYKYGDHLRFGVTNTSNHKINMGRIYGLLIYVKHEGDWYPVKDKSIVRSYSDVILGYGKDVSRLGGRSANPIIPFENNNYDILVYVAGEMVDENGMVIKKVGAYQIFKLSNE